jgi:hypothetical protein
MHADEQIPATPAANRDWWNDPLGVFKPDARPVALKIHGFIIGTFFGPLGVVAVAVLSSTEKRSPRLIGAGVGLVFWLPLWVIVAGA